MSSNRKGFSKILYSLFGVTYRKIGGVGIKWWALKAKFDCSFWSSTKRCKGFKKINDSVKSSLQKRIISYLHTIQSPIAYFYITFKFDDEIRVVSTKLRQKVLLQVYVPEIHMDMPKKEATGFSLSYN